MRASTKSFEGFLQVGFSAHILTVSHSAHLGHFKFGAKNLGAKKGLWAQLDVLCTLRRYYTRVTLGILTWGPRFGPVQPLPLLVTCRWWTHSFEESSGESIGVGFWVGLEIDLTRAGANSISFSKDPIALLWRTPRRAKMARKLETGGRREEDLTHIIYGPCVALSDIIPASVVM